PRCDFRLSKLPVRGPLQRRQLRAVLRVDQVREVVRPESVVFLGRPQVPGVLELAAGQLRELGVDGGGLLRALAAAGVHPARLLEPRVVAVAVLRGLPVGVADEAGEPGLLKRAAGPVALGAEGVGALLLDGAAADAAEEAARSRDRRLHGR